MKESRALRKNRFSATLLLVLIVASAVCSGRMSFAEDLPPRHLCFGVDAVPYSVFVEAQQKGMFKDFRPPSRMISSFPSLTNYAWAVIMNTEKVEGYQAQYYHFGLNRIVGRLFHEVGKPSFSNQYEYRDDSIFKKIKAYITSGGSIEGEMKHLAEEVLSSNQPRLFFAFTEISDITAHMKGKKGLLRLLEILDRELVRIREEHLKKFNEPLEVTLLSDHGNTLLKGKIISVDKALKGHGFKLRKKLEGPDDVIYHTSGILSVACFFIQDERKFELARLLAAQPWADIVAAYDKGEDVIYALSRKGILAFEYYPARDEFRLRIVSGEDPLGLVQQGLPVGEWIPQSVVFEASIKTDFPDSLMRIQKGITGRDVNNPASILVSLTPGCESGSKFIKFFSQFKGRSGTHGSLNALDSIGFISSTDYDFPEWVTAYEFHKHIDGFDFEKRFNALTLISWGEEKCKVRIGQPLLDIPGAASVRFSVKGYDYQRQRFSKSYDLYEVGIPLRVNRPSLHGQARFFDAELPKCLETGVWYLLQAQVLDSNRKVIARLEAKRFHIMPYWGYRKFSVRKVYKKGKKLNLSHLGGATDIPLPTLASARCLPFSG
jgi:hypothetical protein